MLLSWREISVGDGRPISTSLTEAETCELRSLAVDGRVVEVGSAYGYSSVVMGQVAEHVFAIDPHGGFGSLAGDSLAHLRANLAAYDLSHKVSVVVARSAEVLSGLCRAGALFDLVFVDGDHRKDSVRRDVELAWWVLTDGGALACHDYREESCDGVEAALDALFPEGPSRLVDTLWVKTR
jgi:predicted O-methyltransferase YrrM